MPNQGGLVYQDFSHILPSLRKVSVDGAAAATAIPVPGAEEFDVLLGATFAGIASDLSLLQDAVFVDGEVTFATIDTTAQVVELLYFDQNAVLE